MLLYTFWFYFFVEIPVVSALKNALALRAMNITCEVTFQHLVLKTL